MTVKEIEELMKAFEESSLIEFGYKKDGEELHFRKKKSLIQQSSLSERRPDEKKESSVPEEPVKGEEQENRVHGTPVKTPIAGVFYRAPKPGEKPFVEVGQKVKKGETVGLIEAMKMISEIPAPCDGTIEEIAAKDADFVQFGTELMTIGED